MIKRKCIICGNIFYTYPSRIKIGIGKFCSRKCYATVRNKALIGSGKKHQFQKGHKQSEETIRKRIKSVTGKNNKLWKGENVGYRGLHYWLHRVKGNPERCKFCGAEKTTPKSIHWANIDHKYRRNPDDYIALCKSCHKLYDLHRTKANEDVLNTI